MYKALAGVNFTTIELWSFFYFLKWHLTFWTKMLLQPCSLCINENDYISVKQNSVCWFWCLNLFLSINEVQVWGYARSYNFKSVIVFSLFNNMNSPQVDCMFSLSSWMLWLWSVITFYAFTQTDGEGDWSSQQRIPQGLKAFLEWLRSQ